MKKIVVSFLALVMVSSFSVVVFASNYALCPLKLSKQITLSEDYPAPTPHPAPAPAPEPTPAPTPTPEPGPK